MKCPRAASLPGTPLALLLVLVLAASAGSVASAASATSSTVARLAARNWPKPFKYEPLPHVRRNPDDELRYGKGYDAALARVSRLANGCPSIDGKVACAEHGVCESAKRHAFGVVVGAYKVCRCHRGWFGRACHMSELDVLERRRLGHELSALFDKHGKSVHADSYAGEGPERSAFARVIRASNPRNHRAVRMVGRIIDEFEPATTVLERWANPPAELLIPGARVLAAYERERDAVVVTEEVPGKSDRYRTLKSGPLALYTSDDGETIIAPVIYPGQRGFTSAELLNRPPNENKLIDTLNAMHLRKDADGRPARILPHT
jgi:hypothetical protein